MDERLKDAAEFGALLGRRSSKGLGFIGATAERMMGLASRHVQLAVKECNEPVDDSHHAAVAGIEAELTKELASLEIDGAGWIFGGDPRGATVKLKLATGEHNTWGGADEGWAIPQWEGDSDD